MTFYYSGYSRNITIGVPNVRYELIKVWMDRKVKPHYQLHDLQSQISKSNIILVGVDQEFGFYNGSAYVNGTFGAMEKGEIDITLNPVPIDVFNPPGDFPVTLFETDYQFMGYQEGQVEIQDTLTIFSQLHPNTMITVLVLLLILEIIVTYPVARKPSLFHSIWSGLINLPGIFFSQFNANLPNVKHFALTGFFFFLCVINASFSNHIIVGDHSDKCQTLSDIKKLKKIPYFQKDTSKFELFQKGVTSEFKYVYDYAKSIGANHENSRMKIGVEFYSNNAGKVLISDSRQLQLRKMLYFLRRDFESFNQAYISRPFASTISGFLLSKRYISSHSRKNRKEIERRSKYWNEFGFDKITLSDYSNYLKSYAFDEWKIIVSQHKPENKYQSNLIYNQLKISAFNNVIRLYVIISVVSVIIEIIFMVRYYC